MIVTSNLVTVETDLLSVVIAQALLCQQTLGSSSYYASAFTVMTIWLFAQSRYLHHRGAARMKQCARIIQATY